jgi:hypothetical protein
MEVDEGVFIFATKILKFLGQILKCLGVFIIVGRILKWSRQVLKCMGRFYHHWVNLEVHVASIEVTWGIGGMLKCMGSFYHPWENLEVPGEIFKCLGHFYHLWENFEFMTPHVHWTIKGRDNK